MSSPTKAITRKLARSLCEVVDEHGLEFVSDQHGTVCDKVAVTLKLKPSSALHTLNTWEDLGLVKLERKPTRIKIQKLTVNPGRYRAARRIVELAEVPSISKAAQRADLALRSKPAAARLGRLRADAGCPFVRPQ